MSDDTYVFDQVVKRLGLKRALSAIQAHEPFDYETVMKHTLLNTITSDSLLATVLSYLWLDAFRLCQVCKRFASAVRRKEFWLPGVRATLLSNVPSQCKPWIRFVNPFFRFPNHMWLIPDWPWWEFLTWLFRGRNPNSKVQCNEKALFLVHKQRTLSFNFKDTDTEGYPSVFYDHDKNDLQSLGARTSYKYGLRYLMTLHTKWIWVDGPLDVRHETPRSYWCGAVTEHPSSDRWLLPVEGQGFYRNTQEECGYVQGAISTSSGNQVE